MIDGKPLNEHFEESGWRGSYAEDGKKALCGGVKADAGKVQAGLLADFRNALVAVAEVGTFGADKYERDGWRRVENGTVRYTDAMWRHLLAGDGVDDDSGLSHLAHLAWNALALLEMKAGFGEQNLTQVSQQVPEKFICHNPDDTGIPTQADIAKAWQKNETAAGHGVPDD